jgi:hypothetical protein
MPLEGSKADPDQERERNLGRRIQWDQGSIPLNYPTLFMHESKTVKCPFVICLNGEVWSEDMMWMWQCGCECEHVCLTAPLGYVVAPGLWHLNEECDPQSGCIIWVMDTILQHEMHLGPAEFIFHWSQSYHKPMSVSLFQWSCHNSTAMPLFHYKQVQHSCTANYGP